MYVFFEFRYLPEILNLDKICNVQNSNIGIEFYKLKNGPPNGISLSM